MLNNCASNTWACHSRLLSIGTANHFKICWPCQKELKKTHSFGTSSTSCKPDSEDEEGINVDELGPTAQSAEVMSASGGMPRAPAPAVGDAGAPLSTGAHAEPAAPSIVEPGLTWPIGSSRHFSKKRAGEKGTVHEPAQWYMYFSCTMMKQTCGGKGVLMRPISACGDHESLLVIFNGDCEHDSDGSAVGQLLSADMTELLRANVGRAPAHTHANATLQRSPSQQLDNLVSHTGSNPHVLCQALYQERQKGCFDDDQLHSAQKRKTKGEAADRANTPEGSLQFRILLGDTPHINDDGMDEWSILRMRNSYIIRYMRKNHRRPLYIDTRGGM
eukprot:gene6029-12736_t